jgi:hypothetical protein
VCVHMYMVVRKGMSMHVLYIKIDDKICLNIPVRD